MIKAILITVRTASTRLPNKALLKINGKTTIEYLIERMKRSKLADVIVLCTTKLPEDDILCDIAKKYKIEYFRGSELDKLERWNGACKKFKIDFFVTADGDDLFCDHELVDQAFNQYMNSKVDFIKASQVICGAFTYGINYQALDYVCKIKDTNDTEMMWPYFENDKNLIKHELEKINIDYLRSDIRMTLDYNDDFKFFKNIIEHFDKKKFGLLDIIHYIDQNPDVAKINIHCHDLWSTNQKQKIEYKIK
jgi:spore coat polysaccharide biosynthesis protein SpsF